MNAGRLTERVAFDQRVEVNPDAPRDYGNTVGGWEERYSCAAQFIHLRGGETVLAARLAGRHTQVVRVRASSFTRALTPEWQVRDVRAGTVFNIRDVTRSPDRAWVDLLCESGVAT